MTYVTDVWVFAQISHLTWSIDCPVIMLALGGFVFLFFIF
jgi:hypothetical protein